MIRSEHAFHRVRNSTGLGFLLLSLLFGATASAQPVTLTVEHPTAVYAVGEKIVFNVRSTPASATAPAATQPVVLNYSLKRGGLTAIAAGTIDLSGGASQISTTLTEPGTVLAEVRTASGGRGGRALAGAVAAPFSIAPSVARPADFDQFWDAKIKQLEAIAANPVLAAGDSGKPAVDFAKITMDNINGTHIQGQLAKPSSVPGAEGRKFPALLIVQWAGVYPLQKAWVTDRAAEGWLVLNINAHDLPIDEPADFYAKQNAGALRNYWSIGNDDRETSYFLRMYLSCYRGAQYLSERPDWDGKTLAVMGTSQGGQQAFVTAAIHPKITAAMALVPAGADLRGPDAGRAAGWPAWFNNVAGKDPAKVRAAGEYFDIVNFASRIKCPLLVGVGMIDETCPPAGVIAAFNQAKGPKELLILPRSEHQNRNNSQGDYNTRSAGWLAELRQGKQPVIPEQSR